MEIADDGFSRRVMEALPRDAGQRASAGRLMARLWTVFCVALGVALSFVCHLWEQLAVWLEVFVRTFSVCDLRDGNVVPLTCAVVALILFCVRATLDSERLGI